MKILVALLFKNSELWIRRFLTCLDSLLECNENDRKNGKSKIEYDLSILYGTSTDETVEILKNYVNILRESKNVVVNEKMLNLPRRLDSLERLSVLRNVSIHVMDGINMDISKISDRLSEYDYVFQIDTDTIFDTSVCAKLIDDIAGDSQIGVIAPMVYIEKSQPESENIFYDTFAFRYFDDVKLMRNDMKPMKKDDGEMFRIREPYFRAVGEGEIYSIYSVGTFYICRADIFWKYGIKYSTEVRKNLDIHPQRKLESEQVVFCRNVREKTPYEICVDKSLCIYHVDLPKYGMSWH